MLFGLALHISAMGFLACREDFWLGPGTSDVIRLIAACPPGETVAHRGVVWHLAAVSSAMETASPGGCPCPTAASSSRKPSEN